MTSSRTATVAESVSSATRSSARRESKSYSFAPVFEAKTAKQITSFFRDLIDEEDEQSVRFVKKFERKVTEVLEKENKENAPVHEVFANRCEESDLRLVFDLFDLDRDGFLNQEEIQNVLKALGESDVELPKHMKQLNFEQFKKLVNV